VPTKQDLVHLAQNRYCFGMLPGFLRGSPDGQFSSLVFNSSPGCKLSTALELENCPSGDPCLMGHSVKPTFHSQMSTADQPLHKLRDFWCFGALVLYLLVINKHHCKKIGVLAYRSTNASTFAIPQNQ